MILRYCQNQCQTAKQITRWIQSIKTLFTSLLNVILHFACHLNKHTMEGSDSWLWLCGWFARPPHFLSCCHAELQLFSATQLLYPVVQIQHSGCSCSKIHPLHYWDRIHACWVIVMESDGQKSSALSLKKVRVTKNKNTFEFKFTASLYCTNSWANS